MSATSMVEDDRERRLATREFPSQDGMPRPGTPGVRIRGLNHSFGHGELAKQVLFDNKLDITRGEIVIMTGPSGSGKTTLLTLIGGLRTIQNGSIQVMGNEMFGLNPLNLVKMRRNLGYIFQAHNLFASLTALQNVRMALELCGDDPQEMNARAEEMLKLLGLGHRIHYKPESLSGGQRQRVAIARALVNNPSILLADEPTGNLDTSTGNEIMALFERLYEQGNTIVLVTHEHDIALHAHRVISIRDGKVEKDEKIR
jgi:putative ABC transport system ATP-binding protein